jgi:hypothetical protein
LHLVHLRSAVDGFGTSIVTPRGNSNAREVTTATREVTTLLPVCVTRSRPFESRSFECVGRI